MSEQFPWLCSPTASLQREGSPEIVCDDDKTNADSYTTEAYGTYGLKFVYYKVSQNLNRDRVFGEDQLQVIERAFNFMGYTESIPPNVRTYHLEGIYGEDLLQVKVGVPAFKYWSTYGGEDRNTPEIYDDFIPRIGDIVYLEPNDTFYEIRDVKFYNEAFGLASHTYDITLKVYKDTKMTIDNKNPTLSDRNDPIYKVASWDFPETTEIDDPLKHNEILEDETLEKSKNVNRMDVLYKKDEGTIRIDPFDGW